MFCGLLHIPGEQEAGGAVGHLQDNRGVVGLLVLLQGTQNLHLGRPQHKAVPGLGYLNAAVWLGVIGEIGKRPALVLRHRGINRLHRKGVQRSGQPAHMVLMGVGADHILQLIDPCAPQIGHHKAAVGHVAAAFTSIPGFGFRQSQSVFKSATSPLCPLCG